MLTEQEAAKTSTPPIENDLERQVLDLRRVHDASARLLGVVDVEPVLDEALRGSLSLLGTDHGLLWIGAPDEDDLVLAAHRGVDADYLADVGRVPRGRGVWSTCYQRRQSAVIEDVEAEACGSVDLEAARRAGLRACLGVPLIRRHGDVIGVVCALFASPGPPREQAVRLMDLYAQVAAHAIDMARLRRRVQQELAEQRHSLAREHLARAEAEQANGVRDALLVRVCHDLRTPLNTIMGWAHILRTSSPASATVARGLETIARNAEAQTQLLEDVLDASRAMARSLRLETDDVDFVVVLQGAIDVIRPEAEARGVQLGMVMDLEARVVTGDTRRLRQAVSHLLANAVRVTPSGGRVDVRLERADDQANLTVRDGGRAVAPDALPVAPSDPFRPAGIAISQPPGFSLDLWIVRHLVELHGGSVEAESAGDGEGTSITARLPLAGKPR